MNNIIGKNKTTEGKVVLFLVSKVISARPSLDGFPYNFWICEIADMWKNGFKTTNHDDEQNLTNKRISITSQNIRKIKNFGLDISLGLSHFMKKALHSENKALYKK